MIKSQLHNLPGLFLIVSLFLTSCDNNTVFEQNTPITNHEWDIKQVISYSIPVSDTTIPNNFYVNVRNGGNYAYSNLFLFIQTTFPNGKIIKDTLECVLANDKGVWLGKGAGDVIDHRIPFKKNVLFPVSGNYKVEIEQAMRMEKLPEIFDIGFRIEKAQ